MFVCLECGNTFLEPKCWEETHGFDYGPFERFSGSPCCGEAYAEAHVCSKCSEWIKTKNYIRIGLDRYCEDCYTIYELGEEN